MEKIEVKDTMTLQELKANIHTIIPDLVKAAEQPAVKNPFISHLKMDKMDKIQMVLLCFLVPIRLLLLGLTFVLGGLTAKLFLMGYKEENPPMPFSGARRFGQRIIWWYGRLCAFACGFQHISVKGKLAGTKEAPVVVVAPHSTLVDALGLGMLGLLSAVSRVENKNVPLVGDCVRILQPVLVTREKRDSKLQVVKEIKRRAKDHTWPPILIFPEGTCTNSQAFITFKPGAFYPGVPVQPVLLRFTDNLDYSWTWLGPTTLQLLCVMMSRLNNNLEIEVLPVYNPSDEEKADAFLYARNVRDVLAKVAARPVTDHSFEDCRLMSEAQKLNLPMEAGLVEYYKLSPMIGMNCECMIELLKKFAAMDLKKDGMIDIDEFCAYLHLPPTNEVKIIFQIYDIDNDDAITFREYLLGCFLISTPFNTNENILTAFNLFDANETGCISYKEFSNLITDVLQVPDNYIQDMYKDLDCKGTGHVELDEFQDFCSRKPEYALLFIHFRKLQSSTSSMTFSRTELSRASFSSTSELDFQHVSNCSPKVSM